MQNLLIGKPQFQEQNALLASRIEKLGFLIAQHRGAYHANLSENTIPAFIASLQLGADMLELDVAQALDGGLFCFHDGMERRLLHRLIPINASFSHTVKRLRYYNGIGQRSDYKVNTIEEVLKAFCSEEISDKSPLIAIDRAWNHLDRLLPLMKKYPQTLSQCIVKGFVRDGTLAKLSKSDIKPMFLPIVTKRAEVDKVLTFDNLNLAGIEVLFKEQNSEFFSDAFIKEMHDRNLFVWVNAICLGDSPRNNKASNLTDDLAITSSPDASWGVLAKKRYDIIQTDWPALLSNYRKTLQ